MHTLEQVTLTCGSNGLQKGSCKFHLSFFINSRKERNMDKKRFMTLLFCKPERVIIHIIAHKPSCIVGFRHVIVFIFQQLQDCLNGATSLQEQNGKKLVHIDTALVNRWGREREQLWYEKRKFLVVLWLWQVQ